MGEAGGGGSGVAVHATTLPVFLASNVQRHHNHPWGFSSADAQEDGLLFEWLFERRHPGPVGTVGIDHPEPSRLRPIGLLVRGALSAGMIGYGAFLALGATRPIGMLSLLGFYLFVAYFVNPKPDPSNVGWAGGLIDHPFRWSDDQNRMLLALKVVLLPGRLAVAGVRDVVRLAKQRLEIRRGRQKNVVWARRK